MTYLIGFGNENGSVMYLVQAQSQKEAVILAGIANMTPFKKGIFFDPEEELDLSFEEQKRYVYTKGYVLFCTALASEDGLIVFANGQASLLTSC